jgi:hypothetical protein
MEKPDVKLTGNSIYEQDHLDDEALEMIMHPNKMQGGTIKGTTTTS